MLEDAPVNLIKLAVSRSLVASMDEGRWRELALLIDAEDVINEHPRLLRSLHWDDPDYPTAVHDVLLNVLGAREASQSRRDQIALRDRFPNLGTIEEFLSLGNWLAKHDPELHKKLYGDPESKINDDEGLLKTLETHADVLDIDDARQQVRRIRRDLGEDIPAAVGQAKEFVETVCKYILGLHGVGNESKLDVPELVKKTLGRLHLHAGQVDPATPGAQDVRRVLSAVGQLAGAVAPYRNLFGTGHGRSRGPKIDEAAGRFMVRSSLDAVTFLLDVYQLWQNGLKDARCSGLQPGDSVQHLSFGEGTVVSVESMGNSEKATIAFADSTKRLLLRYAPMVKL